MGGASESEVGPIETQVAATAGQDLDHREPGNSPAGAPTAPDHGAEGLRHLSRATIRNMPRMKVGNPARPENQSKNLRTGSESTRWL
jgi:hypothetical protein